MYGVKFPSDDKRRLNTGVLECGYKTTFKTVLELVDFVKSYNTFFCTDKEYIEGKIQKFKQGEGKEEYITQDDIKDDAASVIIVDLDRKEVNNPTFKDHHKAMVALSREFGVVLWAPSATESKIFKGRLIFPLNKRTDKLVFRKYLEMWLWREHGVPYIISHHTSNASYFSTGEGLTNTRITHEFVDAASFNASQKMNIYEHSLDKIQVYENGHMIVDLSNMLMGVPDDVITPRDISHKLQKYGKADDIKLFNKYSDLNSVPIVDKLRNKIDVVKRSKNAVISKLHTKGISTEGKTEQEIYKLYDREFADGEVHPLQRLRKTTGEIKTVREWVSLGEDGNFAFEPNHRAEGGYLYMRGGKIFDYQGGLQTLLTVLPLNDFTIKDETFSGYLPDDFTDIDTKIAFKEAPTGSGKSHSYGFRPDTIFIVPTQALGQDLGSKNGFVYVASTQDKKANLKRMIDMSDEDKKSTIVMTYDKFSYLHRRESLVGYNIVVDEAPLIFKSSFSEFVDTRESFLWDVFSGQFKSVVFMSANPFFFESFNYYIDKSDCWEEVSVCRYKTEDARADLKFVVGFDSETMALFKTQRCVVYCNDKSRAHGWGELLGADVIVSGGDISPDDIDKNPSKSYIFTSVMREGYSFNSHVGNMIIDTRVGTPVGVDSIIQAASRARKTVDDYWVVHNMGIKENTNFLASLCSVQSYKDIADIIYDPKLYGETEREVIKHLPWFHSIKGVVSSEAWQVYTSVLVGLKLENIEKLQQQDCDFCMLGLNRSGYTSQKVLMVNPVKIKRIRDDKVKITPDEIKDKKGKKAYSKMIDKFGRTFAVNGLINTISGLKPKKIKAKRPTFKQAVAFLEKNGIKYSILDGDKNNVSMYMYEKYKPSVTIEVEDLRAYFGQDVLVSMPPPPPPRKYA
jgi:hypothetical protein